MLIMQIILKTEQRIKKIPGAQSEGALTNLQPRRKGISTKPANGAS